MNGTAVYLIAFSSYYKAAYAQETLMRYKIRTSLRKVPPGLLQSCGYGITLRTDGTEGLKQALRLLNEKDIRNQGVFVVRKDQATTVYDRIYL